jgi:hypothetical protein
MRLCSASQITRQSWASQSSKPAGSASMASSSLPVASRAAPSARSTRSACHLARAVVDGQHAAVGRANFDGASPAAVGQLAQSRAGGRGALEAAVLSRLPHRRAPSDHAAPYRSAKQMLDMQANAGFAGPRLVQASELPIREHQAVCAVVQGLTDVELIERVGPAERGAGWAQRGIVTLSGSR